MTTTESQNIEFKESWRDEYLKWICGFANAQGGTFSNFDLYDDYAKDTPEATVKHIKKKLIG